MSKKRPNSDSTWEPSSSPPKRKSTRKRRPPSHLSPPQEEQDENGAEEELGTSAHGAAAEKTAPGVDSNGRHEPPTAKDAVPALAGLPFSRPLDAGEEERLLDYLATLQLNRATELRAKVDALLNKIQTKVGSGGRGEPLLHSSLIYSFFTQHEPALTFALQGGNPDNVDGQACFTLLSYLRNKASRKKIVSTVHDKYMFLLQERRKKLELLAEEQKEIVDQLQQTSKSCLALRQKLDNITELTDQLTSRLAEAEASSGMLALHNINDDDPALPSSSETLALEIEDLLTTKVQTNLVACMQHHFEKMRTELVPGVAPVQQAPPQPPPAPPQPPYPRCDVCKVKSASKRCEKCKWYQCSACMQALVESTYMKEQNVVECKYFCSNFKCKHVVSTAILAINKIHVAPSQANNKQ